MQNHEVGLPLSGGCVERLHGPGQAICGIPSLVVLDGGVSHSLTELDRGKRVRLKTTSRAC